MNAPGEPALRLTGLVLGYGRRPIVHGLDAVVAPGALLAVVGPNGSGKTTLLRAIAGEVDPIAGTVERALCGRADVLGYLPQHPTIELSFPISVFDFVALGSWPRVGAFGGIGRAERARVRDALSMVGLDECGTMPIGTLSGGQLQRARFARLALQDARLLLLDEPYAALDAATVDDLAALVDAWHAEGRTILTVLHDLDHVAERYPDVLALGPGGPRRGPPRELLGCGGQREGTWIGGQAAARPGTRPPAPDPGGRQAGDPPWAAAGGIAA